MISDIYILKSSDALETIFFLKGKRQVIYKYKGVKIREKNRKERQDKTIVVGHLISNAKSHGSNVCRNVTCCMEYC